MARTSYQIIRNTSSLFVTALLVGGCAGSTYHLPPPPTAQEQAMARKAAEEASSLSDAELDQQARNSLLKLYALLQKSQFEEAERYLSQETRDFLSAASTEDDPSAALSSGEFRLRDGRVLRIDPVKLLLGGNIVSVQDALKEADEGETSNRRVLYIVDPQGQPHRVIMISEGGEWVLHMTTINPPSAGSAR